MRRAALVGVVVGCLLIALPGAALIQDTDIYIIAAGRGGGANQSVWITTLYIYNPNVESTVVQIFPLERNKNNANVQAASISMPAGTVEVLDDVILNTFGKSEWFGAFRIIATKPIAVEAAISNVTPTGLFGHGVPGLPSLFAVNPAYQVSNAQVFSVAQDSTWRTNLFAVAVDPAGASFSLTIYDVNHGVVKTVSGLSLQPYEAKYWSLGDWLDSPLSEGFIDIRVNSGAAHFLGSRVNQGTNDPLTLEPTLLAIRVREAQ